MSKESILHAMESSYGRKETAEIDILITPRNGDRKIMQANRLTDRPPARIRKVVNVKMWKVVSDIQKLN